MSEETYTKIWGWVTLLAILAIITAFLVAEHKRVKEVDYGKPVNCVETPNPVIVDTEFEDDPTLLHIKECFMEYNEYNKTVKRVCKTWERPE